MSLLTIRSLRKEYFGRVVIDDLTMNLDDGERLALIGDNGAGKTTLLRLIAGRERPDGGTVSIAGMAIPAYLPQHLPDQAAAEDQTALGNAELEHLEDRLRAIEDLLTTAAADEQAVLLRRYADWTARFETAGGYDYRRLMAEALAGLGLAGDILERPLATLSGGERMRVALARLLLSRPDLLLLDEPTNHLDLAALEWLENYLRSFRGAVLFVSHDRTFIDRAATSVARLADGKLTVRPGGYSRFQEIENAERLSLEHQIKQMNKDLAHQQAAVQSLFSHRKMSSYHAREKVVERLSSDISEIAAQARRPSQRLRFSFLPAQAADNPSRVLVDARGLSAEYDGQSVFRDVSLLLLGTSKTCLCGPNGCGKTTLLNVLLGRKDASAGELWLTAYARFGLMEQQMHFDRPTDTVLTTLTGRSDLDEGAARLMLARFGFRGVDIDKKVSVLSGGERARLFLACLICEQPDVLFLDEPTNHLDIESREILEEALRDYGGAILAVSHDRYFINRCAREVIGFDGGTAMAYRDYDHYRQAVAERLQAEPFELRTAGADSAGACRSATQAADAAERPARLDPTGDSRNRAEARRLSAARRNRISALEKAIATDEAAREEYELRFRGAKPVDADDYQRYAELLQRLDDRYDDYLLLQEDPDDGGTS